MKKLCNILLIVLLVATLLLTVYAVVASSTVEGLNAAISLNLIWCYVLFVAAILAAVGCAVWGMIKSPAGLKGALMSLLLIAAVVIVSYVIANGHDIKIVNLDTGGYFDRPETVISDAGILVTYVAFAGAILAALYSEISNALK